MISILEVGAFISSLVVGRVGDIIGRRRTIFYGSVIFVFGGALQAWANGMTALIIGRVVAGIGVGCLSTIVPVYQSEISPPHNRGQLACIEFTGNIVGYASSVWVDYFCSFIESDNSWRLPLFMQCLMGTLLALGSLLISESPRYARKLSEWFSNAYNMWQMAVGQRSRRRGNPCVANLHGGGDVFNETAREEFRMIKMDVLLQRSEGERSYSEMWSRYRKRLLIAMSAQGFAQMNGINVISYYVRYPVKFCEVMLTSTGPYGV